MALSTNYKDGARELASYALDQFLHFIPVHARAEKDKERTFEALKSAAGKLAAARPPMRAAISAALLRALHTIDKSWQNVSTSELQESDIEAAQSAIKGLLDTRNQGMEILEEHFFTRIRKFLDDKGAGNKTLNILTLSSSSTIRHALFNLSQRSTLQSISITITILESRPRCEGIDLASSLLTHIRSLHPEGQSTAKFNITLVPDAAVASVVPEADILLLGADKILPSGNITNKIGSLSACCCAKLLNPKMPILVLSDTDKIIATGDSTAHKDAHGPEELWDAWSPDAQNTLRNTLKPPTDPVSELEFSDKEKGQATENGSGRVTVGVYGDWFEEVSADMFELEYITDREGGVVEGVTDRAEIQKISAQVQWWRDKYGV